MFQVLIFQIGFAKFRSRSDAINAIDTLCGKKIDQDRGFYMKAEIAKKNLLITKRSISHDLTSPHNSSSIVASFNVRNASSTTSLMLNNAASTPTNNFKLRSSSVSSSSSTSPSPAFNQSHSHLPAHIPVYTELVLNTGNCESTAHNSQKSKKFSKPFDDVVHSSSITFSSNDSEVADIHCTELETNSTHLEHYKNDGYFQLPKDLLNGLDKLESSADSLDILTSNQTTSSTSSNFNSDIVSIDYSETSLNDNSLLSKKKSLDYNTDADVSSTTIHSTLPYTIIDDLASRFDAKMSVTDYNILKNSSIAAEVARNKSQASLPLWDSYCKNNSPLSTKAFSNTLKNNLSLNINIVNQVTQQQQVANCTKYFSAVHGRVNSESTFFNSSEFLLGDSATELNVPILYESGIVLPEENLKHQKPFESSCYMQPFTSTSNDRSRSNTPVTNGLISPPVTPVHSTFFGRSPNEVIYGQNSQIPAQQHLNQPQQQLQNLQPSPQQQQIQQHQALPQQQQHLQPIQQQLLQPTLQQQQIQLFQQQLQQQLKQQHIQQQQQQILQHFPLVTLPLQQQSLIPQSLISIIQRDQNPPCNTLYVGNLPIVANPEELEMLFSRCKGYKRLCFRMRPNGPMCFVEFEDVICAAQAMKDLYGVPLTTHNIGNGIRLSFSKNPLGVRLNTQRNNTQPSFY
ncbi:hypothetical protein HK099_003519 [Clydaea vesicula]|uniref:RRM domain-containing protein n=1 Tax=Clydaea vesicula TaxID=447962 RepID=A0AAD5XZ29_9FUNG|nr:hypothetical protein HK099_003519 [Clydaea vesicula]